MPGYLSVQEYADSWGDDHLGSVDKIPGNGTDAPRWIVDEVMRVAAMVGLRDWRFHVAVKAMGERAGSCMVAYGRKVALIELDEEAIQGSPKELLNTIVHELLHCHFIPVVWAFNGIGKQVPGAMFTALFDGFSDALELAIDGAAAAWATALPGIERPEVPDG